MRVQMVRKSRTAHTLSVKDIVTTRIRLLLNIRILHIRLCLILSPGTFSSSMELVQVHMAKSWHSCCVSCSNALVLHNQQEGKPNQTAICYFFHSQISINHADKPSSTEYQKKRKRQKKNIFLSRQGQVTSINKNSCIQPTHVSQKKNEMENVRS